MGAHGSEIRLCCCRKGLEGSRGRRRRARYALLMWGLQGCSFRPSAPSSSGGAAGLRPLGYLLPVGPQLGSHHAPQDVRVQEAPWVPQSSIRLKVQAWGSAWPHVAAVWPRMLYAL